jgi:hypothetical protein
VWSIQTHSSIRCPFAPARLRAGATPVAVVRRRSRRPGTVRPRSGCVGRSRSPARTRPAGSPALQSAEDQAFEAPSFRASRDTTCDAKQGETEWRKPSAVVNRRTVRSWVRSPPAPRSCWSARSVTRNTYAHKIRYHGTPRELIGQVSGRMARPPLAMGTRAVSHRGRGELDGLGTSAPQHGLVVRPPRLVAAVGLAVATHLPVDGLKRLADLSGDLLHRQPRAQTVGDDDSPPQSGTAQRWAEARW